MGLTLVTALHLAGAAVERRNDRSRAAVADGYVPVCDLDRIPEKRARIVSCGGERVAVFKYGGRISAVSNVCQHQNGPLGEGKIIDGCITCPWHGYQYLPESGASPPPFTEKVPTFRTLIVGNQVFVHPSPLPAGTRVEPSSHQQNQRRWTMRSESEFYVGYLPMPDGLKRTMRRVVVALGLVAPSQRRSCCGTAFLRAEHVRVPAVPRISWHPDSRAVSRADDSRAGAAVATRRAGKARGRRPS